MKKIMILGANNFLVPLIKTSKRLGYWTIIASPDEKEPGFEYADEKVIVDLRDKNAVLEAAQKLKIDGIISDQAETPVRTQAFVANEMGLPGIGEDKAELFTNKYLMREKCREIGIDTIKYKLVDNVNDAVRFYEQISKPMIMKPIDSAGSRGVVKIEDAQTIYDQFDYSKEASKTGKVIIEEYIPGKELLIDGVVWNGVYQTLICGEYIKCNVPGVFSEYMGKYPAEITDHQLKEVDNLVKRIIEGFGLPWGRTHTEVKINDNGIWLMETAARGGGRFISSGIVPMKTDFDSCEFLLKACVGDITEVPVIHKNSKSCGYVSMFLPKGEVVSVEGLQEVIDLPYTYSHNFEDIKVGFKTSEFKDKIEGRFIHLEADNDDQLYERVEKIKQLIQIKIDTGEGMKGPIWE
uniref:ATP-grasp domain-containing protein n=1 Tax=Roseburia inulinivorans TaxID=360807 RepID=UPI0040297847